MLRKIRRKMATSKAKAIAAKRRPKKAARRTAPKAASATPTISRDVIEEVLIHSAKSAEGEQLSDTALTQIAAAAGVDAAKVLDAHERLCEAADAEATTVFRIVELWEPYE